MTTLSKTTIFWPPSSATIGSSLITRAVSRSTWLCSSASAPLRRTITFRGLPDVATTRWKPAASESSVTKTTTTSAMPPTAMADAPFRTAMLRRLYENGIAMLTRSAAPPWP